MLINSNFRLNHVVGWYTQLIGNKNYTNNTKKILNKKILFLIFKRYTRNIGCFGQFRHRLSKGRRSSNEVRKSNEKIWLGRRILERSNKLLDAFKTPNLGSI